MDASCHHQPDVAAWLPKNEGHLLGTHTPHVHITDLQDVVSTSEVAILQKQKSEGEFNKTYNTLSQNSAHDGTFK